MPIRETPNCVRYYALIREEWEPIGEMFTEYLAWFVWFMEWNRSLLIPKISRK